MVLGLLGAGMLRRIVVALVVLVAVLIGVDRVAVWLTERALAGKVQKAEHLEHRPGISVKGFPFLTQVVGGRYDEVDVAIRDLHTSVGLNISELDAALIGVHVRLSDVIKGDVQSVPVDRGTANARITYADIDAALSGVVPGGVLAVHTSRGTGSRVRLAIRYTGPGGPATVGGVAGVTLVGGRLHITPLADTITGISQALGAQIARLLTVSFALPLLPFGYQLTGAGVDAAGVELAASGSPLELVRKK
jgi:hypothetical protein